MREKFRYTPLENYDGYSVEDEADPVLQTLYNGYRKLEKSPGTGKIGVLLFPQFLPENDLIYSRRTDDPLTNDIDESVQMPSESWPKTSRPPLINFGGNRVGIVGQRMMFDANESQLDEDIIPTSFKWYVDDKLVAEKSIFYKVFPDPGLYKITCEIQNYKSSRYVRIISQWGESDIDVVKIGSLNGSVDSGWQISLDVKDQLTNKMINPYQGIMLYVYDTQKQTWRRQYNNNMKAINRRMKNTSDLPPDPLWQTTYVGWKEGDASYYVYTEEPKNPLLLQEKCWPNVDFYLDTYIQAQSKYGAPANLGRALACELTYGNKTYPFGSSRFKSSGAEHVRQGMLKLAEYYRDCGNSWKKAIKAFVNNGVCGTDDKINWNSTEAKVFENWSFLDNVGGVGSSILAKSSQAPINIENLLSIEEPASVLFFGYIDSCNIQETANETTLTLSIVNTAEMLNKTFQRMESYWESGVHATSGGTVMDGPPMRSATCIHHLLTQHSNFAEYHDVVLDWAGPRFWSTSSPEGTTWQAISGWAGNDYAWAFANRYGQLRYMTRPQYRGSQWYTQAIKEAIRIDEEHVIEMQVQELRMLKRTAYTRLCGTVRGGNCEICGEFPCGGPTEKSPGQWSIKRGLQYDDYRVLCRFSAYDYAYENRSYDIQVAMPWRHDLDLGDLVFFPYNDVQKRFLWNIAAPPVFVIKQISHQYDVPSARWITTISAEQLTYGVACDCDNQTCPTTQDDGICDGDIGCDLIMDPDLWKIETSSESRGQKIVSGTESRLGYLTTYNSNGTTSESTFYEDVQKVSIEDAQNENRTTSKGTVGLVEPYLYLTETIYNSNIGNAISQSVDMSVPYFTISAKGPIGGSLKIEIKLRAKKRKRAYIDVFYLDENGPITSETNDYFDGQTVIVKDANVELRDASNDQSSNIITKIKINTEMTIVGGFVENETKKFYPVVVNQLGDYQSGDQAMIRLANTPIRTAPGLAFGYVTTFAAKDVVLITGESTYVNELVWYPIKKNTTTGWVTKNDLGNLTGWVDGVHMIGKQFAGQDTIFDIAQSKIPKDLHQTITAFPLLTFDENQDIADSFTDEGTGTKNSLIKIATIEQYDFKLRNITGTEFTDTVTLIVNLPTKDSFAPYKIGFMTTSEYQGEAWSSVDAFPAQELESWLNESTLDDQVGACECDYTMLTDFPYSVQQAVLSLGPISVTRWKEIRDALCTIYPRMTCPVSTRVSHRVYDDVLDDINKINQFAGKDLIYIEKQISKVGASASLEVSPACKDCFDPAAASQNNNWNIFGSGYGSKPSIFLLAGHASYNDTGNSSERDYNILMAKAYKEAFLAAGYPVTWWQEADGDSNTTMSPGNHITVATGVSALMSATDGQLILLDLHHEMTAGSATGLFAIIPDAAPDDTWDINVDARDLGKAITQNIKLATNVPLRTAGVKEPGLMSETQTGAAEQGGRLATFYYTKSLGERAVRLVIEHGNMLSSDMAIISKTDFPLKCAEAAVKAVDQVYPSSMFASGCDNWPTVSAIDVELKKMRNGKKSPMADFAAKFIEWGGKYAINPAFVLALCFSESQYGTDGELPVYANNYGGHGYNAEISTCPRPYIMAGREWSCYTTALQGAEALFKFLDRPIYRSSGGTIKNIIDIYSPYSDNAKSVIDEKYAIIKEVGRLLGTTLDKTTQIYADISLCVDEGAVPTPGANYNGYTTMFEWSFHQAGAYLTQGPYMAPTHMQCDCYDFGVGLNTAVYPILDGTVSFAKLVSDQNRPWQVKIQTAYGTIVYSHLNSCNVRQGQKVYLNTMIGRSGTCCDSIIGGPHLHIGLQGGKAGSTGGKYTFANIFQLAGINLSRFERRY